MAITVQQHHALHCWEKIRVAFGLELTEKTSRTPSKLKQLMGCREEAMELIRWISSAHHNPHVWCPKREITNHTYCELGEKNTKPDVTGIYVMFEAWLLLKSGHQILRTTRFYQSHHWDYFSGSRRNMGPRAWLPKVQVLWWSYWHRLNSRSYPGCQGCVSKFRVIKSLCCLHRFPVEFTPYLGEQDLLGDKNSLA